MIEKRALSEQQVLSKLIANREYWQEIEELRQTYEVPPGGFVPGVDGIQEFALWTAQARRGGRDPMDAVSQKVSEINRRWQYPPIVDEFVLNELLYGSRYPVMINAVVPSGPHGSLDPEGLSGSLLEIFNDYVQSGLAAATSYFIFGKAVFIDSGQLQQLEWQLSIIVLPGAAEVPSGTIRLHSFSVQPCHDWATGDGYELETEDQRYFLSGRSVSLASSPAMAVHWKVELPGPLEADSLYAPPHMELETLSPFGIAAADRSDGAPTPRVRLVTDVGGQVVKGALPAFPVPQASRESGPELLGLDTLEEKWQARYERAAEKATRRLTAKEFASGLKLVDSSYEDCIEFWHFAKKHINPELTLREVATWSGHNYGTLRKASSRLKKTKGTI